MTTERDKQTRRIEYDPGEDPLAAQVGARETERILADPEIDAKPQIVEVHATKCPGVRPVDPHPSQLEGKYRE